MRFFSLLSIGSLLLAIALVPTTATATHCTCSCNPPCYSDGVEVTIPAPTEAPDASPTCTLIFCGGCAGSSCTPLPHPPPSPPPPPELEFGETGGIPAGPSEFDITKKGPKGALDLLSIFGAKAGVPVPAPKTEPEVIIGRIIQLVMVGIGAIFGVLVIYGGYLWMVARGNEELVTQAFETIRNATIGIVVIVGAYALTSFVVNKVITAAFTP